MKKLLWMILIVLINPLYSQTQDDIDIKLFISSLSDDGKIYYGDTLILYLPGIYDAIEEIEFSPEDIELSINDHSFGDIDPFRFYKKIPISKNEVIENDLLAFIIDNSISKERLDHIRNLPKQKKAYVHIALPDDGPYQGFVDVNFIETDKSKKRFIWSFIAAGIIVVIFFWMAFKTNILKNETTNKTLMTYSLSRTQLWWWSLIIIGSFFYLYVLTNNYDLINQTAWILLGISAGTTGVAVAIDKEDKVPSKRFQVRKSQGLIKDILQDETGSASIHRLQSVIFNLGFGVIYVFDMISVYELPIFDTNTLVLLGVSNGAYTLVKSRENKKPSGNSN